MTHQTIALFLGILLVLIGLGLTIYQMIAVSGRPSRSRGLDIGTKGISLKTTFPGLVVLVVGVVVLLFFTT
jgi:hypothetical protein